MGRRNLGVVHHLRHHAGQARVAELDGRQVHRHGQVAQALVHPAFQLGGSGAQHPLTYRQNQPAALGQRDELGGRHQAQRGVLPAQQRLGPHQAAIGQGHLRLVVQRQFVALQRVAQVVFQQQGAGRMGLHVRFEKAVGVAPLVFGAVHGHVGGFGQGVEIGAVGRVNGNAHREGHHHVVPVQQHAVRAGLQQLFRHLGGLHVATTGQQQHKLVAALARQRVTRPQHRLQAARRLDQQRIARAVAQGVVDVFEVVQVDEHHRQRLVLALGHADGLLEAVGQQQAVGQAGQGVEVGQPVDLLFAFLAVGDVFFDGQVVRHRAIGLVHRRHAHRFDVFAAVFAAVGELAHPGVALAQVAPHVVVHAGRGFARLQQPGVDAAHLVKCVAGGGVERTVGVFDARFQVGDDDGVGALLHRQPEFAQRGLVVGALQRQAGQVGPALQRAAFVFWQRAAPGGVHHQMAQHLALAVLNGQAAARRSAGARAVVGGFWGRLCVGLCAQHHLATHAVHHRRVGVGELLQQGFQGQAPGQVFQHVALDAGDLLQGVALGHVGQHAVHAGGFAVGPPVGPGVVFHPEPAAIGGAQAVALVVAVERLRVKRRNFGVDAGQVFGVHQAFIGQVTAHEAGALVTPLADVVADKRDRPPHRGGPRNGHHRRAVDGLRQVQQRLLPGLQLGQRARQ